MLGGERKAGPIAIAPADWAVLETHLTYGGSVGFEAEDLV